MAECYLQNNIADVYGDECSNSPRITAINTKLCPTGPPLIPILNIFMREPYPRNKKLEELDPTSNRLSQCDFAMQPNKCETWQCAYLEKHPNVWPPPTATSAIPTTDVILPPKQLNKLLLSRKDIEREVARRKVLAFYGGAYDIETICRSLKWKKKSKTKRKGSSPQPESVHVSESETEQEDPEEEPEEEPEPKPASPDKKDETPIRPPRDPNRTILKNKAAPVTIPRVAKPYHLPHAQEVNPISAVNFLPGRARLVQRYKAEEMNRAMRKRTIVEEADARFNPKCRSCETSRCCSQPPSITFLEPTMSNNAS